MLPRSDLPGQAKLQDRTGLQLPVPSASAIGKPNPVSRYPPTIPFAGLDQAYIGPLPRLLIDRGEVDILLTVDGKTADTVTVNIQCPHSERRAYARVRRMVTRLVSQFFATDNFEGAFNNRNVVRSSLLRSSRLVVS